MTAAIFGVAGVVLGVVLSALLTYYLQKWADERRWEREDKFRDHDERRKAYADFLAAFYRLKGGQNALNELRDGMAMIRLVAPQRVRNVGERLLDEVESGSKEKPNPVLLISARTSKPQTLADGCSRE